MSNANVPTPAVWNSNAAQALATDLNLAQITTTDAAATGATIAAGILATIATAAAPVITAAMPGPEGILLGAAVTAVGDSLQTQHQAATAALTPAEQQLVTQAVQVGAAVVTAKLAPGAAPTPTPTSAGAAS